ncbi:MAG: AsmA family protein [Elusimicrobia bacterium]|nr:AsmA family protein [Elusimicrobiota bacterium]
MKRFLKWMAVLALIGLAALTGMGVWLRHSYPPERIRRLAAEKLGARLGRQVEIAGANVSLVRGLELEGVRISESPDFSAGTFVEVGRARILPRLLPLLSHRILVRSIDLERPRVRVHRAADGTFNFSDLAQAPAGPPGSGGGTARAMELLIARAALTEGEFTLEDDVLDLTVGVHALDARLAGFSLTDPFGLRVKGNIEVVRAKTRWAGPLAMNARMSPTGNHEISLERFTLRLGSSSLELSGTLTPLPSPQAEVTLAFSPLAAEDIEPMVLLPDPLKQATLSGRWKIRASSASLTAEGTFDAQNKGIAVSGALSSHSTLAPGGDRHGIRLDPKTIRVQNSPLAPGLSMAGPLTGRWEAEAFGAQWKISGEVAADEAVVAYEGWLEKPAAVPLTLTGSAHSETGAPELFLDLRAPALQLRPGGPWPAPLRLEGALGLTAELQGVPSNLAFDLTAEGQSLQGSYGESFRKTEGSPLQITAAGRWIDQQDIQISSATCRTAAGVLKLSGEVEEPRGTQTMSLRIDGDPLDLSRLGTILPSLAEFKLRGEAALHADISGPATDPRVLGQVRLRKTAVTPVPGVELSELAGRVDFNRQQASVHGLSGKAFGSPFTLNARVDNGERPAIFLDGDWARLEVDKVLKAFSPTTTPSKTSPTAAKTPPRPSPAPIARAAGVFRIGEITHPHYLGRNFQFNWNLRDVGPDLSVLSGTASVTAASGEITDVPVAKKINKLMGREGAEITYQKLAGQFVVTRGLADIKTFTLDSDQTDFLAKGRVRLGDLDSDLTLQLKLPPGSVRGSVGDWITAEDGRPTIEASLKGPLGDPKVKVDYRDTVRRAAQDILKKAIGGWKGKPDRSPDPKKAPSSNDAPAKDPLGEAAGQALERLFKKK